MEGVFTALITPFKPTGFGIDEALLRQLIERQIDAGVQGIVLAGSTGEGQTMTEEEWNRVLAIGAEYTSQILVMGSCGSSSTWQSTEKLKQLEGLGLTYALVSSPPYNKPTQAGLIEHFKTLAQAAPRVQIMAYNIPGRTAVNILPETMQEIWKIPSVKFLKESSGNWSQFLEIMGNLPPDKMIFSGDDPASLSFYVHGAKGLVSVLSNIAPRACVEMWNASKKSDFQEAQRVFNQIRKFTELLFCESNPIPTKFVMSEVMGAEMLPRLPLLKLSPKWRESLVAELGLVRNHGWLE